MLDVERSSVSRHDTDPEVKDNAKDLSLTAEAKTIGPDHQGQGLDTQGQGLEPQAKDIPYCPRGQGHGLEDSNTG